jgi:hypothetical protein
MVKTGYPYFYGSEDLDQDKTCLGYSLKPMQESLKLNLNLTHAASSFPLVTIVEKTTSELGDEFAYEFCDQITQICKVFRVIPDTQTVVLDYDGFCQFASESDLILNNISLDLRITKESAVKQAQQFFQNKNVLVQATGVHGVVYKVGSYVQSAGSAALLLNTMGLARLAGVTGLEMLQTQPMLAVAIPTSGAMFFYGCGMIAGNNTLGKSLVTVGDVLAVPMKGVEIMWNSYGNPVTQKVFGIPVILNMTQTLKIGPGYSFEEISKYIRCTAQSPLIKKISKPLLDWWHRTS